MRHARTSGWKAAIMVCLTVVFLPSPARSPIQTAATCSVADVQTAIDAAVDGDVVQIPDGACTWTAGITTAKQITITGQTRGSVRITHSAGSAALLDLTTGSGFNTEVSQVHFLAGSGTGRYLDVGGSGRPPLIHDNYFDVPNFQLQGCIRLGRNGGVIYRNTFESLTAVGTGGSSGAGSGCVQLKNVSDTTSWSTASTMGISDADGTANVYIEDNTFNNIYLQAIDCDDNARVVVRHNLFNDSAFGSHGADSSPTGCRHGEVYDNTFVFHASGSHGPIAYPLNLNWWVLVRGASWIFADNVMPDIASTDWGNKAELAFQVQNLRRNSGPYPCWTTYPAPHQVGQSHDGSTGITDPVYIWDNTGGGAESPALMDYTPNECGPGAPLITQNVQSGRDYVLGTPRPGYAKYVYPHPLVSSEFAGIPDDGLSHPPPAVGPFAYNAFVPAAGYVDPVFGTTVLRLSGDGDADDSYARNMWWNADETRYLHRNRNGTPWADFWDVIEAATGTVTHNAIPIGDLAANAGFDPVDPEALYKYSANGIRRVSLAANGTWTESDAFTAPITIEDLGGTLDWLSADGRYMVVRYGAEPSVRVYDRQNLAAGPYASPVDFAPLNYVGITPDGAYLVGYRNPPAGFGGMGAGVSWALDHASRSIAAAPTEFWSLCGDHGDFLSASDGRNYMVVANCYDLPQLWAVDITNDAAGMNPAQQRALPNNRLLIEWPTWSDGCNHYSTVARGRLRDWAFCSTENGADAFDTGTDDGNGNITPWAAYRQEIMAFDVVTGEVRRIAHHRSRSVSDDYFNSPRLSSSWGGRYVSWNSNFNQNGSVDAYAVPFAVTSSGGPDTSPPVIAHTPPVGPGVVGEAISFAATVVDDVGVVEVRIVFGPPPPLGNETMTLQGGAFRYTLAALSAPSTIRYRIVAVDAEDNWAVSPEFILVIQASGFPWRDYLPHAIVVVLVSVSLMVLLHLRRKRRRANRRGW